MSESSSEICPTRHSPIIVGERYELAETIGQGGENQSGLLANSDYQAALLHMSGYEKNGTSDMNGFDVQRSGQVYGTLGDYTTGRTSTDGSFSLFTHNGLAESQAHATPDPVAYSANTFYQPRADYGSSSRTTFDEYAMRKAPEVKSYNPTRGSRGSPVHVYIRAEFDLEALIVSLMFSTRRVQASLSRLETHGSAFEYCVTAIAPHFFETESSNPQIQLRLHLQEHSGQDAGLVDVGYFQYVSNAVGSSDGSRKRKLSTGSGGVPGQSSDNYLMAYPDSLHSTDTESMQRRYSTYNRNQHRFRDITSRRSAHDMSRSPPSSRPLMHPPGAQSSTYNPSYSFSSSTGRTLNLDGTISSPNPANPPLIRTSTIPQSNPASAAGGSAGFNPYALYPQKAVLKLRGNLNSMAENWTPEEWGAKRRLVRFWRSQNKSTIHADFAPVKPEERPPNSTCISCIWWEERQQCFATSVDTIYLLEQLVALRFTVEEKNRIRRNLEGFKPLTVAKGKADSEEFFKVIMGFPNPKPRNIEKDVKVFEWKILAGALKKIMSKYSASYSSTAGALPQARNSMYPDDLHVFNRGSSRSASNSTASTYATAKTLQSSPSETHTIGTQYSDQGSFSGGLPVLATQNPSYASPSLGSSYGTHQDQTDASHLSRRHTQQYHSDHSPLPALTHSYTTPIERSRSSQGPSLAESDPDFRYAKRPRANTIANASIYASTSPAQPTMTSLDVINEHSSRSDAVSTSGNAGGIQAPGILPPSLGLPPPSTPSYATPSRGFSESHTQGQPDFARSESLSAVTPNIGGEGFGLLASTTTAGGD